MAVNVLCLYLRVVSHGVQRVIVQLRHLKVILFLRISDSYDLLNSVFVACKLTKDDLNIGVKLRTATQVCTVRISVLQTNVHRFAQ